MADNKKSVLLYCDIIHTVDKLSDEEAGKLFKHYLNYINDLNPVCEDRFIEILFEPIKQNLKRDLKKWEDKSKRNSDIAKAGWDKRKDANECERIRMNAKNADKDKVIDTVIDKNINSNLNFQKNENSSTIKVFEVEILKNENEKDFTQGGANDKNKQPFKQFTDFSTEVRNCVKECAKSFESHLKPKTDKEWVEWLKVVDRVNREGLPFDVIEEMVKVVREDDFWSKNFLSLRKLTKKNKEGVFYYIVFSELINQKNTKYGKSKRFDNEIERVVAAKFSNTKNG